MHLFFTSPKAKNRFVHPSVVEGPVLKNVCGKGDEIVNGMKKSIPWILAFSFSLLAASAFSQPMPWQAAAENKAVIAARAWLALVDEGDYEASWTEAAGFFRKAVSKTKWVQTMDAFRKPLGKLIQRKLESARFTATVPGAPDGKYVIIRFQSSFQNKKSAVETITPMLDKDGQWRVSGYYIK